MNVLNRLWPLMVVFLLALLGSGRLLENDNVLADHSLRVWADPDSSR